MLWAGLARYLEKGCYEHLIGCASVSMADGGGAAAALYNYLETHMSPLEYRVFPRCPLPLSSLRENLPKVQGTLVPPLIKGYLRAGAWICGAPAWDPDFNTADLPVLLPMRRLDARHARHFMGKSD